MIKPIKIAHRMKTDTSGEMRIAFKRAPETKALSPWIGCVRYFFDTAADTVFGVETVRLKQAEGQCICSLLYDPGEMVDNIYEWA